MKTAVLLMALALGAVRAAPRYIDPGSGSFAIQILIATVVGALMTVRLWWTRLLSVFYRLRPGWRSGARADGHPPAESGRKADARADDDGPAGQ